MLNKSGIAKQTLTAPRQILANVELQCSIGCIVKQDVGATVGTKKIAKAGTPVKVDFSNVSTPVEKADGTTPMNAVLLHDVDVTAGNANGTALIFGFVNVNRVEEDVASAIATAQGATDASKLLTFVKL